MDLKLDGLDQTALLDASKVNDGIWVHLDSAEMDDEGQYPPLYLNGDPTKPQRAKVRSHRCKAIKDLESERQKKGFVKFRVAKKKERDGVIAENSILPEEDRFACLLVALENFSAAGGVQQVSAADAKAIHGMTEMDNMVQQIREASYDDSLYLADAGTSEGNGSPSTSSQTSTATAETTTAAPAE